MSLRATSRVWEYSKSTHAARLVLLALADFADDGGVAYPSIGTLEKRTALSERAVQGALKVLVALGELRIDANAARAGANLYRLKLSKSTPAESAPPQTLRGANPAPLPQNLHPTPAESAPNPRKVCGGTVRERSVEEPPNPPAIEPERGEGRDSEPPVADPTPLPPDSADVVPMDELRTRLGKVFALTPRELRGLERGDEKLRTLFNLALDRPTLDALERLWAVPNGTERRGVKVWHATTLSAFCSDPTKDIGRARQSFSAAAVAPRKSSAAGEWHTPGTNGAASVNPSDPQEAERLRLEALNGLKRLRHANRTPALAP